MEKLNIAVIYGGFSSEHEISISSGKYVSSVIDKKIFNVYEIIITKQNWIEQQTQSEIDKNDFSIKINNKKIKFDAVINVIHGTPGENGLLQSYFELVHIAYVGCNTYSSAISFNKFYCNNYLRPFNVIKIAKSIIIRNGKYSRPKVDEFISKVGYPVFIKPSSGGSSFGTSKVKTKKDIDKAIREAFQQSEEVMIEEFIKGREFTCAVVKQKGKIRAFTPVEIVSKNEFFDYESKYNPQLNEEIIPPRVENSLIEKIQEKSIKIYELLNCSGIVRVDYLYDAQDLYFLELNSIPGMTAESIVPKMIKYDNVNISDLYTELIREAIFEQI
jgi:D-alanine-D-alanine ligase